MKMCFEIRGLSTCPGCLRRSCSKVISCAQRSALHRSSGNAAMAMAARGGTQSPVAVVGKKERVYHFDTAIRLR